MFQASKQVYHNWKMITVWISLKAIKAVHFLCKIWKSIKLSCKHKMSATASQWVAAYSIGTKLARLIFVLDFAFFWEHCNKSSPFHFESYQWNIY